MYFRIWIIMMLGIYIVLALGSLPLGPDGGPFYAYQLKKFAFHTSEGDFCQIDQSTTMSFREDETVTFSLGPPSGDQWGHSGNSHEQH